MKLLNENIEERELWRSRGDLYHFMQTLICRPRIYSHGSSGQHCADPKPQHSPWRIAQDQVAVDGDTSIEAERRLW